MNHYRVVITDELYGRSDVERSVLEPIGAELFIHACRKADEVLAASRDADGILVNLAPMPASVIQGLRWCKIIARYGVGYDNVDLAACTRRRIFVANVPDYCAEEVSDHALALLMGCIRKIARRDAQVRAGNWNMSTTDPVYRIAGKTFAFLGFGLIARCLRRKIAGLDLGRILVYDPYLDAASVRALGAEPVDLAAALREADYLSIHMPLNDTTRDLINEQAFAAMKPTAIIINTSRGPIIDEAALVKALASGQINSAGLDVHCREPIEPGNPLLNLPNCILTDHMGWYSEESIVDLKRKAAENIRDVLLGGIPSYPVNRF